MDIDVEKRVNEAISQLRELSIHDIDFDQMDPIAKMMLIALVNECQKIQDYIDGTTARIVERFCTDFIPREKVEAIPAISLVNPSIRSEKNTGIVSVGSGASFTYKPNNSKRTLSYIPLFSTSLISYSDLYVLTPKRLSCSQGEDTISMDRKNCVWIGITTPAEIECLKGLSVLVTGTNGILPEHIYVGIESKEISFSTMSEMEDIEMAEPFDAQQSSSSFFSILNVWKEYLQNMKNASLLYVTDEIQDRDLFKPRTYPRVFLQWLEDEVFDRFGDKTSLWLQLVFPEGYEVPDSCRVSINILPVVNVDVNSLTLTQSSPIAKLQKQEDSYFLKIIETSASSHKQGFNMTSEDIIVRDFDAACYHNGDLYRDVRNLYNKFIDDYYAFIEYNGIKDGEVLKQLRETINRLGKSVGEKNAKFRFDSGTYVMKNMNQYPPTNSTKVSYMATQGELGNSPQIGETMEAKKLPAIEPKVTVVVPGMGGANKASADERYELLRYYSLTNDRLYTKMDIEAFLRKEIMAEFGKDEFKRIFIKINVEGAGGISGLQRGLYIDIEFKDKKNFEKATSCCLDKQLRQKIDGKSCISMPIIINLINLEI